MEKRPMKRFAKGYNCITAMSRQSLDVTNRGHWCWGDTSLAHSSQFITASSPRQKLAEIVPN